MRYRDMLWVRVVEREKGIGGQWFIDRDGVLGVYREILVVRGLEREILEVRDILIGCQILEKDGDKMTDIVHWWHREREGESLDPKILKDKERERNIQREIK